MANKNIEAKIRKMKRAQRKAPRSYDRGEPFFSGVPHRALKPSNRIAGGFGPNREVIAEYKSRAYAVDPLLEALFPARFKGVPAGKFEILQKMAEELKHVTRIKEFCGGNISFALLNNCLLHVRVFCSPDKTCYIIMEENFRSNIVRSSMTYGDKERIVSAWHSGKIRWVEFARIPHNDDA